jgi:hypothetical protein
MRRRTRFRNSVRRRFRFGYSAAEPAPASVARPRHVRRPAVFRHDAVLRSRFEVILISSVFRCRLRARLRNR